MAERPSVASVGVAPTPALEGEGRILLIDDDVGDCGRVEP